ncbi:Nucleotide-binding, alpha-beta plait [Cynara cardunculus var. scolymus]|uniref:Nucleotide-binding, alpha-beta plait n=1 Tax=Cynara cardunculus var. scolymus TaxID=59895 RepID=A0A103XV27_CYNCS|nr:Nucleotide-binding, alpha-beta plait [Cynara cardunculus var. scolymus]
MVIVLPTATAKLLRLLSSISNAFSNPYFPTSLNLQSSVSMAGNESKTGTDVPLASTPNSKAQIKTVKVSNVSMAVNEKDIWEFFSFSGDIHYIEMKSESETTKHAFVTFKDSKGADTAALLTGATIADFSVSVTPVDNYKLPPEAPPLTARRREVVQKAEDVVSTMLAKGFVLGKDALRKAQSFDEKHQFTTSASTTYASLDRKIGLTKNLSMGRAVVNEKMKAVDERYQVSEATKSAIAVAEQKAASASNALMRNHYVSSGVLMVSNALSAFAKAAEDVGSKTKEKLDKAEEEKGVLNKENTNRVNDVDESSTKDSPVTVPATSSDNPAKSTDNPAISLDNPAKSTNNPATSLDNPAKSPDNPATSSGNPAKSPDNPATSSGNPAKSSDTSNPPNN